MKIGFVLVNNKFMVKVAYRDSIEEAINEVENTVKDACIVNLVGFPEEQIGSDYFLSWLATAELVPCIVALDGRFDRLRSAKARIEVTNQDYGSLLDELNKVDRRRRELIEAVKNSRERVDDAKAELNKIEEELGVE